MSYQQPYGQPGFEPRRDDDHDRAVYPAAHHQPAYQPQAPGGYPAQYRQAPVKRYGLHGAEPFWYLLGCIWFGVAYFSKLPAKKAACEVVSELQLDGQGPSQGYTMSGAATFWYYLMCIPFGSAYFAKVSAKKALWEVVGLVQASSGDYGAAMSRALYGYAATPGQGY